MRFEVTGVRDVRYIRFMFAEYHMFKVYTDLCSLIKSMMTVHIPIFVFRNLCLRNC